MWEPCPRTMYRGSHPTLRKARTGEFTPPGISCSARFCSLRDSSVLRGIGSSFPVSLHLIEFIGDSRNRNTPAISRGYLGDSCPSNREGLLGTALGGSGLSFFIPLEMRLGRGKRESLLAVT